MDEGIKYSGRRKTDIYYLQSPSLTYIEPVIFKLDKGTGKGVT